MNTEKPVDDLHVGDLLDVDLPDGRTIRCFVDVEHDDGTGALVGKPHMLEDNVFFPLVLEDGSKAAGVKAWRHVSNTEPTELGWYLTQSGKLLRHVADDTWVDESECADSLAPYDGAWYGQSGWTEAMNSDAFIVEDFGNTMFCQEVYDWAGLCVVLDASEFPLRRATLKPAE